jgi:hypothetical protein
MNILMKTSPIPIECLNGILRVAIAGILNQSRYLLKEQLLENCWDWYDVRKRKPMREPVWARVLAFVEAAASL